MKSLKQMNIAQSIFKLVFEAVGKEFTKSLYQGAGRKRMDARIAAHKRQWDNTPKNTKVSRQVSRQTWRKIEKEARRG